MKKTINSIILVFSLILLLSPSTSWSQTKEDTVIMKNGEKKTGKVISVNSTTMKFSYSQETAEYEINKSEVSKIVFASGRTETFDNQQQPITTPANTETNDKNGTTLSTEQRKNKIAILPFEIETNDQGLSTASMSKQIQETCITALRSQSPFQTIQDPMLTNTILAKKNLTANDLSMYTPKEWAELLGTEYVIIGSYSIQNKGTSTFGSNTASYNSKTNDNKTKGTAYGATNSYTTINYDTHVNISIYNDNGEQIFSDSRSPALGGIDSYKSALKTIMKRSPFGKK
ncbi:hypothetical protein [Flavobacterium aestivum]|uniref:hypothetical protein n=1 Tax=Flavobacterium aestivum TaxID=3003257 RepID=UPI00248220CA|nr:hypothetical protein [Flavobacterium aestivum]